MLGAIPKSSKKLVLRGIMFLAIAACLANVFRSWRDQHEYGGTDLRAKVVGARLFLSGENPYGPSQQIDERVIDPDRGTLSRCTYPPTLLLWYGTATAATYGQQRALWIVVEWLAFFTAVGLLAGTLSSRRSRFWFVAAALGLFGGAYFWRVHLERGQYYVFVLLLISLGTHLILRRQQRVGCGVCFGLAACLRPTAILLTLPYLFLHGQRRTFAAALVTLILGAALPLAWGPGGRWVDYLQLTRSWELAILGESVPAGETVLAATTPARADGHPPNGIDGYRSRILMDFSCNVALASILRGFMDRSRRSWDPRLLAAGVKLLWAALLLCVGGFCARALWSHVEGRRFPLLCGVTAMLLTDYFVPIRLGYSDILFMLPLALLTPMLLRDRNRELCLGVVAAFLLQAIPIQDLPRSYWQITTALRSLAVMYVALRFCLAIAARRVEASAAAQKVLREA